MLQKAKRSKAKIKMAIQGPSGSGKTYSALLLAYGLCGNWDKIAVIDTENHSSDLYADLGDFNVLPLTEPYTPEKYVEAINVCISEGMEVVIMDSISHEWDGIGGILDIHSGMAGNSFTNWSKVTPRHNQFVNAILQASCHIISTIRTKQDYVLADKNGKMVPEKVGLKGVTRDGIDYEFTLVFDIDIKHQATASKDRTGLFMDKPSRILNSNVGQQIKLWCESGDSSDPLKEEVNKCTTVEQLVNLFKKYPNHQQKLGPLCKARKAEIDNPSQSLEKAVSDLISQPLTDRINGSRNIH